MVLLTSCSKGVPSLSYSRRHFYVMCVSRKCELLPAKIDVGCL